MLKTFNLFNCFKHHLKIITIKRTLKNEPILEYKIKSPERDELKKKLSETINKCEEVPIVIGDKEFESEQVRFQGIPCNHNKRIAKFYYANPKQIRSAINVAKEAQYNWSKVAPETKYSIWQRGAELMATKYRQELNAATMLGQAKTVIQAEIDSACELIDFFRFNSEYLRNWIPTYSPISTNPAVSVNTYKYRPLDGFIAAISPFNFTAISGNLSFTPALMGNTVLWKPSDTAILSNWIIFKIMREAGIPPGVVNFIPSDGQTFGLTITESPDLGGINFTGSVKTFQNIWHLVGNNIGKYKCFPRLVGECGGKNFHFVHPSADIESVVHGTLRSAFEYSGQKCSSCSRMYVPESIWPSVRKYMLAEISKLKVGDISDFKVFTSSVIDSTSFKRISNVLETAKKRKCLDIIHGGNCSDEVGYYVDLTLIVTEDPLDPIMTQEIFGPVIAIFVYKDNNLKETMQLAASSTDYALTGSIFSQDKNFISEALETFEMAAGNFYINDKSTGSVVGQQPFGGGRLSGTNDKAGSPHYLLRWASPQNIKETFIQLSDFGYPYMLES